MAVRIGGPHGGMTVQQLDHYEHIVETGGGITKDDSPSEVQQKLREYNNAVEALHDLGGGKGALQYASVPEGGYSGHYEIDPEALDDTIKEWQSVLDGLDEDQQDIDAIRHAGPPAPDKPASVKQAHDVGEFGDRMHTRNQEMRRYAEMYLRNLKGTRDEYQKQEHHTADGMRQQEGEA